MGPSLVHADKASSARKLTAAQDHLSYEALDGRFSYELTVKLLHIGCALRDYATRSYEFSIGVSNRPDYSGIHITARRRNEPGVMYGLRAHQRP